MKSWVYRRPFEIRAPQAYRRVRSDPFDLNWLYNPATQQYVILSEGAGWDTQSLAYNQVPPVVSGDILVVPLTVLGYPIVVGPDGILIVDTEGDTSRLLIPYDIYDVSLGAFYGGGIAAINDLAPVYLGTGTRFVFPLGVPITPFNISGLFEDPEDDPITSTAIFASVPVALGTLVPGLDLIAGMMSGIPTTKAITIVDWRGYDPYGLSAQGPSTFILGTITVPDVVGANAADATAILAALYLNALPTGTGDIVLSQSPEAGTEVQADSIVEIFFAVIVISIEVEAFEPGYFGEIYRNIGDRFEITSPQQYSPYWMTFIEAPPADWIPQLAVFSEYLDREMLEFGRPVEQ